MTIKRDIHLKATIEIQCCRDGVVAYAPKPQEFYKYLTKTKDSFDESLDDWKQRIINFYDNERRKAADDECKNMAGSSETLKLCAYNSDWSETTIEEIIEKELEEKFKEQLIKYQKEREQELIKRQKKQKQAEQKKKTKLEKEKQKAEKKPKPEPQIIPVTIDEEPTTIIFKKELTTMDVIQISRLAKSITKFEKQKEEQQKYLNITLAAIERIEESGKLELMLGQIVTRDRWIDEINRTNIKIEKQNEAIEHIRIGG